MAPPSKTIHFQVLAADTADGIDLPEQATVDVPPQMIRYALTVAGAEPDRQPATCRSLRRTSGHTRPGQRLAQ